MGTKRSLLFTLGAFVAISTLALAQTGPAGKWTGETQGRGGVQKVTLELKVDAGKVTGTYTQGEQPAADISDGKVVDASTVTFKRTVAGRGGGEPITIEYTGKVSGAEMTLTPMVAGGGGGRGGGGPITLKRAS